MDINVSENYAFILLLLDVCERFGFRLCFRRLYKLLKCSQKNIPRRLQAAALFLLDIKQFSDYEKVLIDIVDMLKSSYDLEEDSIYRVITTLSNYYAHVVNDFGQFNPNGVLSIRDRIFEIKKSFSFLNHIILDQILLVDTADFFNAYTQIHCILETYLNKGHKTFYVNNLNYIIEEKTEYCNLLLTTEKSFKEIRQISVENSIGDIDLGRGVKILEDQNQLYAYMSRFGNMHYAKMLAALEIVNLQTIGQVEVLDWGCGQGLASLVLIENYELNISLITLIDPSDVALKRAALHINHLTPGLALSTVCKKINDLIPNDFNTSQDKIKVHLFSNILDIDDYSQKQLINTIINTFNGLNYFICVSPFINELKTIRIESFKKYFETNFNTFKILGEYTNKCEPMDEYWNCNNSFMGKQGIYCTHTDNGCYRKWSRIIRVFKVNI